MPTPVLKDWNWHVLMLGQALLGAITHNVRTIRLLWADDHWVIETVLDNESDLDRELAAEVAEDTASYIEGSRDAFAEAAYATFEPSVVVNSGPLRTRPCPDARVVYARWESS